MITKVHFHRFKQYREKTFDLHPEGISLVAGGNNSGKSTLLQGLAIWEFCRMVLEMERGSEVLFRGANRQGLGLGDEEFSPIAVPSLSHLWTNLKTQKEKEKDGYTLHIGTEWGENRNLHFGLSLVNDRLFIKVLSSSIRPGDRVPRIAYLPSFAGMVDKEERVSLAIRRRRIGEGLSGSVLRNILLDMYNTNERERMRLRDGRSKIRDRDLRKLRMDDPWERLQRTLRSIFGIELIMTPFSEEYHSYIRSEIAKGEYFDGRFKRRRGYRKRDLMVEGSGFLQWLSVYALAFSADIDVILLDEPDAHLHPVLQTRLMDNLKSEVGKKQILLATHSAEMIKRSSALSILEVSKNRYLKFDYQKTALLEGIGAGYFPKIDRARYTKQVLFVENESDFEILEALSQKMGIDCLDNWVIWPSIYGHRERRQLFLGLRDEISGLVAASIRDRDDRISDDIKKDLTAKGDDPVDDFMKLTWKRKMIENYLIFPPALAEASGKTIKEINKILSVSYGLSIGDSFPDHDAPRAILDADGKDILHALGVHPISVVEALPTEMIPADIRKILDLLDCSASS